MPASHRIVAQQDRARSAHHLDARLVALVAVGGMVGTGARYLLSTTIPAQHGWPAATSTTNVVGSFLLGALLEALLRRGPENHRRRLMRLGLGTGVLGGFTTFSSLAIELERLLAAGQPGLAAGYAAATLVCGLLACLLGVAVAARHHRWRAVRLPADPDTARLEETRPAPEQGGQR